MSKRAILYARVSTDEQANNYSLPTQLEACRSYAQQHGFQVLEEITDDCSGSIPVMARPGGSKVYDYLNNHSIAGVIMYTIDRSARDKREYPIEFMIFLRDVQDAGAELHFVDTGKSDGGIIDMFRAWQASEERRKIRERTVRGKRARAKSGKWTGGNVPPYGYRRVGDRQDSHLEIDPHEAAIVQRIFDWYTGGERGEYPTLRAIARQLTAEGIAPPNRHKAGRGWYIYTLKAILNREAYLGKFSFVGIPIELPELRIIEPEVWQAAQAQLRANREQAQRNRLHEYLLGGHVTCTCGRKMSGTWARKRDGGKYFYYICTSKKEVFTPCGEKWVRADWLDAEVWQWLDELLRDEDRMNQQIDEIERLQKEKHGPQLQRLQTVESALEKVTRKIARLAQAYGDAADDTLAEVFNAELKQAAQEKESLVGIRDGLKVELSQRLDDEGKERIRRTAANIRLGIEDPDFATKREVIEALNVQVYLLPDDGGDERKVQITCEIGDDTKLCNDRQGSHTGRTSGLGFHGWFLDKALGLDINILMRIFEWSMCYFIYFIFSAGFSIDTLFVSSGTRP